MFFLAILGLLVTLNFIRAFGCIPIRAVIKALFFSVKCFLFLKQKHTKLYTDNWHQLVSISHFALKSWNRFKLDFVAPSYLSTTLGHSLHSLKSSSYFSPMTFQADIFDLHYLTLFTSHNKSRTQLSWNKFKVKCFPKDVEDRWTNISSFKKLLISCICFWSYVASRKDSQTSRQDVREKVATRTYNICWLVFLKNLISFFRENNFACFFSHALFISWCCCHSYSLFLKEIWIK